MTVIEAGTELPVLEHTPTEIQLFRYSAVTWNPHRIHFDPHYAASEGHPGLLMHSHLHAATAMRQIQAGLGDDWEITTFRYRLRHPAPVGTRLEFRSTVTDVDGDIASIEAVEVDPDGHVCLEGWATAKKKASAA